MVELRVIEGGIEQMPSFLLNVLANTHAMLADVCEDMAACLDACPPEKVDALLAQERKQLRRLARRFLEDMDDAVPEAAALTKAGRTHLRLCVGDLIKAGPAELRAWGDVHRREVRRLTAEHNPAAG